MFENASARPRRQGTLAASLAVHAAAGAAVFLSGALATGEPPDVEIRVIGLVPEAPAEPVRLVASVPRGAAASSAPAASHAPPSVPRVPITQPVGLGADVPEPQGGDDPIGGEDAGDFGAGDPGSGGGDGPPSFGSGPVVAHGPGVTPPVEISTPPPVYPELARRAGIEGLVVLEAIVDSDGRVTDVRVQRGVNALLDREAVATVSRWRYKPARVGGRAVACYLTVSVNFTIRR